MFGLEKAWHSTADVTAITADLKAFKVHNALNAFCNCLKITITNTEDANTNRIARYGLH